MLHDHLLQIGKRPTLQYPVWHPDDYRSAPRVEMSVSEPVVDYLHGHAENPATIVLTLADVIGLVAASTAGTTARVRRGASEDRTFHHLLLDYDPSSVEFESVLQVLGMRGLRFAGPNRFPVIVAPAGYHGRSDSLDNAGMSLYDQGLNQRGMQVFGGTAGGIRTELAARWQEDIRAEITT